MELEKEIELLKEKIKFLERQKELESDLINLKRLAETFTPCWPFYPTYPTWPTSTIIMYGSSCYNEQQSINYKPERMGD
jgi:hypothetical protein